MAKHAAGVAPDGRDVAACRDLSTKLRRRSRQPLLILLLRFPRGSRCVRGVGVYKTVLVL
jgi:hypothetical protein